MKMVYKNALCRVGLPDMWGYGGPAGLPYDLVCHRKALHQGRHQVKFKDGKYRKWNDGDKESVIEDKPEGL